MDNIQNINYIHDIEQLGNGNMLPADVPQAQNTKTIEVNHNKPWRILIRRIVSDGRSDYENISGNQ